MKTIKIFLASTNELANDRKAFEIFLYQKSKLWQKERNIFFELQNWEDFNDAMDTSRLQDKYNASIRNCDIFVMLFWTKVGIYTNEEFETAYAHFMKTTTPLIYTYFKSARSKNVAQPSLKLFIDKLKAIGHFKTEYENTDRLLLHFNAQLDKIYGTADAKNFNGNLQIKMNKLQILELIDKNDFFAAFEELNKIYQGKNDSINALIYEFVNPPGTFSLTGFTTRLKIFVNHYV
jgi:hypothetical protein